MAIQKAKIGTFIVKVCHRTTIANSRQSSVIKQPDNRNWS